MTKMTNQEELERIITDSILAKGCGDNWIKHKGGEFGVMAWGEAIDMLAKSILDAGFVKKDSIELDEEKIKSIVMLSEIGQWARAWKIGSNYSAIEWNEMLSDYDKLAHAIAQAKDIIK